MVNNLISSLSRQNNANLINYCSNKQNNQQVPKQDAPKQDSNTPPTHKTFKTINPFYKTSGNGSSGGKGGNPFGDEKSIYGFLIGFTLIIAYAFYANRYREIKWRDFLSEYLLQNRVDHLEVVNKRWVRVILDKSHNEPVCVKIILFFFIKTPILNDKGNTMVYDWFS